MLSDNIKEVNQRRSVSVLSNEKETNSENKEKLENDIFLYL